MQYSVLVFISFNFIDFRPFLQFAKIISNSKLVLPAWCHQQISICAIPSFELLMKLLSRTGSRYSPTGAHIKCLSGLIESVDKNVDLSDYIFFQATYLLYSNSNKAISHCAMKCWRILYCVKSPAEDVTVIALLLSSTPVKRGNQTGLTWFVFHKSLQALSCRHVIV